MPEEFQITYEFDFQGTYKRMYTIRLNRETTELISDPNRQGSYWTELEFLKCRHCPLTSEKFPFCPIAINLEQLVQYFKDEVSHKKCTIKVITEQRTYMKDATVQTGLYSIFGLVMPTSGCPHFNFLKPMAHFHLPFSTLEETVIRVISMYLATQYFIWKQKGEPDWKLENLEDHYKEVQLVNGGIISRIRSLTKKGDADYNAITILDAFASMLNLEIYEEFKSYTDIFVDTFSDSITQF